MKKVKVQEEVEVEVEEVEEVEVLRPMPMLLDELMGREVSDATKTQINALKGAATKFAADSPIRKNLDAEVAKLEESSKSERFDPEVAGEIEKHIWPAAFEELQVFNPIVSGANKAYSDAVEKARVVRDAALAEAKAGLLTSTLEGVGIMLADLPAVPNGKGFRFSDAIKLIFNSGKWCLMATEAAPKKGKAAKATAGRIGSKGMTARQQEISSLHDSGLTIAQIAAASGLGTNSGGVHSVLAGASKNGWQSVHGYSPMNCHL